MRRHLVLFFLVVSTWAAGVDPDENRDAIGLITSKGYQAEQYIVQTDDGYKLTVHRIPCRRNETGTAACSTPRPVAFLQHGLLCSSTNWLTNLANESLGFLLADAGFDVFLGNVRGNAYSLGHISLTPSNPQFWKFSFDEFAKYDLPAMVNMALSVSGQDQLTYIGHSQGTMIGFIQFGEDKELASKIKHFYALGPVTTVKHIEGLLRLIAPFTKELQAEHVFWNLESPSWKPTSSTKKNDPVFFQWFLNVIGVGDFLPNNWLFKLLARTLCTGYYTNPLCQNTLFLIAGYDSSQMNTTRIPVYVSHSPSGTSSQDVVHFGQLVNSGKFAKFDYGGYENMKRYGSISPPVYDVSKMQVPTTLYWGEEDWLADRKDIEESLLPNLQNVEGDYELKETNHLDLIWGMKVVDTCYKPMIKGMLAREAGVITY